jgi:hypothetical protein
VQKEKQQVIKQRKNETKFSLKNTGDKEKE